MAQDEKPDMSNTAKQVFRSAVGGENAPFRPVHEFKAYLNVWRKLWEYRVAEYKELKSKREAKYKDPSP